MKLDIFKLGLLAVLTLAAAAPPTYAQLPVSQYTQNKDELLLGFTIPTSTGDLVIDLGKASDVGVGGTTVVDLNAHGNVAKSAAALLAQLNSLYFNMNGLSWGVVGGHYVSSHDGAVYTTVPHGALAPKLGVAGTLTSAIDGAGLTIDGTATPPNQMVVDPTAGFGTSWTEQIASQTSLWQLNASNPDSTTTNSFATGGLKYQLADLYYQFYNTTNTTLVYKGYFTLGNDGSLTFTPASTTVTAPSVTTVAASSVTTSTALLNANVNPDGGATTFSFQYGTNTSYGSATPAVTLANGTSAVSTNSAVTGLLAGTTYHYRVAATNSAGYALGGDLTFTTLTTVPVTSPKLGGLTIGSGGFGFTFTNTAGASFTAWGTTNVALPLSQWSKLGPVTVTGPGQFQLIDASATNSQQRFYRVTSP